MRSSRPGTLGRKLATRDILNRGTVENLAIFDLQAVTNHGLSNFLALETAVLRRFSGGLQFQVSHTWSRAIDNQSDPLVAPQSGERGFQREFDSAGDRGNADFDQRHNLMIHLVWQAPRLRRSEWVGALLSGWRFTDITGYHSGFPLTVIAQPRGFAPEAGLLILPRADYLGGPVRLEEPPPAAGGVVLLDRSRFALKLKPELRSDLDQWIEHEPKSKDDDVPSIPQPRPDCAEAGALPDLHYTKVEAGGRMRFAARAPRSGCIHPRRLASTTEAGC